MRTIRGWRTAHGWTQRDLAEAAGVSVRSISLAEQERLSLTPYQRKQISEALGISPRNVFWGTPLIFDEDIDELNEDEDEEYYEEDEG